MSIDQKKRSAWKHTIFCKENLLYKFPCRCTVPGEKAERKYEKITRKPLVVCIEHQAVCESIIISCEVCGVEMPLPLNKTRKKYCDTCKDLKKIEQSWPALNRNNKKITEKNQQMRPFCIDCGKIRVATKKSVRCPKCAKERRKLTKRVSARKIRIKKTKGPKTENPGCIKFDYFCDGFCVKELPFMAACKAFQTTGINI